MKQRVGIARALAIRPAGWMNHLGRSMHSPPQVAAAGADIWETPSTSGDDDYPWCDEAIFMSDRLWWWLGPAATIGEILKVPFPHPRDRASMRNSKEYFELRNHALNFLDRYFTQDE